MKKTLFIKNAAILTVTSIILRVLGIFFKIFLAGRVGSEGIGLYHLIFSVYTFAATFASGGITVAVTRLSVCELSSGNKNGLNKLIRNAVCIVLTIALLTFAIILFCSRFIALNLLNDPRAQGGIAVFTFSLPFMGVSAVLKGYFAARRKVFVNSIAILLEQGVRIAVCLVLVEKLLPLGTGAAVTGVFIGDTVAEIVSCLFMIVFYSIDQKKTAFNSNAPFFTQSKEILRISTPITLGRYATTLLRTIENILVPKTLTKAGGKFAQALSLFGALKGMALPLLFFPSVLLNSFSALLIPEMSEALVKKQPFIIKTSVKATLKLTFLFGAVFCFIFFFAGERIGVLIYSDKTSGVLIKILAPLVPLMYLDSISDGILKGLDQQIYTFRNSVLDSLIRIVLILIVVPHYSMNGFIYIMYFSNIFTCFLNVGRLIKITNIKFNVITDLILPAALSFGFCSVFFSLFSFITSNLLFVGVFGFCSVLLYGFSLLAFKIIEIKDYI